MERHYRTIVIVTSVFLVLLSAIGLSLYGYQLQNQKIKKQEHDQQEALNKELLYKQTIANAFSQLKLGANAVYVQNLTTSEIIFEKNADTVLPLASLVKIIATLTALEHADTTTTITFSPDAVSQIGDQGFAPGEQRSLGELIPFMLATSSNDAAYAIGETISVMKQTSFTELMNDYSRSHGFATFDTNNATGLDIIDIDGTKRVSAYGSARDIASLMVEATRKYPEIFSESAASQTHLAEHNGVNTNTLTGTIPGFLVSKTGYTDKSRGNLAFIVEIGPNQPYLIVIMGSTFSGRFNDAEQIIKMLYRIVADEENNL